MERGKLKANLLHHILTHALSKGNDLFGRGDGNYKASKGVESPKNNARILKKLRKV